MRAGGIGVRAQRLLIVSRRRLVIAASFGVLGQQQKELTGPGRRLAKPAYVLQHKLHIGEAKIVEDVWIGGF